MTAEGQTKVMRVVNNTFWNPFNQSIILMISVCRYAVIDSFAERARNQRQHALTCH